MTLPFIVASVDFASSWTTLWGSVSGSISGLTKILGIIGLLLVVGSVLKWLWERRRGGVGGGFQAHSHVLFTLVLGAVLAAPNFMIEWMLVILDTIVNAIASIGSSL
jgi:hypothetical protein